MNSLKIGAGALCLFAGLNAAYPQSPPQTATTPTANKDGGHGKLGVKGRIGANSSFLGRTAHQDEPPVLVSPANEGAPVTHSTAK